MATTGTPQILTKQLGITVRHVRRLIAGFAPGGAARASRTHHAPSSAGLGRGHPCLALVVSLGAPRSGHGVSSASRAILAGLHLLAAGTIIVRLAVPPVPVAAFPAGLTSHLSRLLQMSRRSPFPRPDGLVAIDAILGRRCVDVDNHPSRCRSADREVRSFEAGLVSRIGMVQNRR
jgi:hypothetical protein